MNLKKLTIECWRCSGRGVIRLLDYSHAHGSDEAQCPDCNGTGRVRVGSFAHWRSWHGAFGSECDAVRGEFGSKAPMACEYCGPIWDRLETKLVTRGGPEQEEEWEVYCPECGRPDCCGPNDSPYGRYKLATRRTLNRKPTLHPIFAGICAAHRIAS